MTSAVVGGGLCLKYLIQCQCLESFPRVLDIVFCASTVDCCTVQFACFSGFLTSAHFVVHLSCFGVVAVKKNNHLFLPHSKSSSTHWMILRETRLPDVPTELRRERWVVVLNTNAAQSNNKNTKQRMQRATHSKCKSNMSLWNLSCHSLRSSVSVCLSFCLSLIFSCLSF